MQRTQRINFYISVKWYKCIFTIYIYSKDTAHEVDEKYSKISHETVLYYKAEERKLM